MTALSSSLVHGVLLLCTVSAGTSAMADAFVGSAPYQASASGAGNSYSPVFSADGRRVAFVSHANNLVTNDDRAPHLDLFLRDLVASNTVLVSVNTNGFGGANDNIGFYTLSSNAQVIAFDTDANNLAAGDTNRWRDIYVRDLASGVTRLITPGANGHSSNPLISEDGQRVIFESLASNLVTNDFNGTNDIFVHDLTTGVTELVSVNSSETASGGGVSHSPSISADGRKIAFASRAKDIRLLTFQPFDFGAEIFVRDLSTGITHWAGAAASSWAHAGGAMSGAYDASEPVMSRDGRYVAFKTFGLVARFDLQLPRNSIFLSYTNSTPEGARMDDFRFADNPRPAVSSSSTPLAVTPDGRYLALNMSSNIVPSFGIGLVDFDTLVTNVIEILSGSGAAGTSSSYSTNVGSSLRIVVTNAGPVSARTWTRLSWLSLSADGSRISFVADATNLVDGVTNRVAQLYSRTMEGDAVALVTTNSLGNAGPDLISVAPAASPDGSLVGWDSPDPDMVEGDLNRAWDVFVRNLDTGETTLVSAQHLDMPAVTSWSSSRLELNPRSLSGDGQKLALVSFDGNQAPDDTNGLRDIFVRNLKDGVAVNASEFPRGPNYFDYVDIGSWPSLSADGRFLTYSGDRPAGVGFSNGRKLFWRDLYAPTNRLLFLLSASSSIPSAPTLDGSGRLVAFVADSTVDLNYPDNNGTTDVFVQLMTPHSEILECIPGVNFAPPLFVSEAWGGRTTANGPSTNVNFTPDSRLVFFESRANNLLETAIPPQSAYQLYARPLWITNRPTDSCPLVMEVLAYGSTRLISYASTATSNGDGIVLHTPLAGGGFNPKSSGDSRYVAFESAPGSIYRHDLNARWIEDVLEVGDMVVTNRSLEANVLVCTNCANAAVNLDGRFVAYESRSGTGDVTNIFLKNLNGGAVELVSVSLTGTNGNGSSFSPSLRQDARFVVFASRASDLVPGDNNRVTDIFVRDRWAGVTHCLSRNLAGTGTGNRVSSNPILSADGRTVAFQSFASDLVAGDYNDTRDVFVVTLGGPDNDGDGMEDDWEVAYFNTLARDGSGDFDNDGASDRDEFRAGTSPANEGSILRVLRLSTGIAEGGSSARSTVILWQAVPGRTYRVEVKADLNSPWQQVGEPLVATSTTVSISHAHDAVVVADNSKHFYRVVLVR